MLRMLLDSPFRGAITHMALPFPFTDSVVFQLGPLAVRWYALAYMVGMLVGWLVLRRIVRAPDDPIGRAPLETLLNAGIIGIIFGGRLVYVLFYNLPYYASAPIEVLYIWQGGMAFHGGMLGMACGIFYASRRHNVSFLALTDLVALVVPIGLFLGRIANFVNCELYGHLTDKPWGVVFNQGTCVRAHGFAPAGDLPRHPSQLYEALLEGALLFALLLVLFRLGARQHQGLLTGVFLLGYGCARAFVELFRVPDSQLGFLWFGLTMGQILSLPMLAVGLYLIIRAWRGRWGRV